jgi:hypothetical protein
VIQECINFFKSGMKFKFSTFTIPTIFFIVILICGLGLEGGQQFTYLAQSFLHGHLYFMRSIGGKGQDPVLYHGKIYWDDGPFPSILLMPFVAIFDIFHVNFYLGYLEFPLTIGVFYLVKKLALLLKYTKRDSHILAFGFVLGSVFIGVMGSSSSWLFAQVLTTFLLFFGLYEYYTRKRWWVLGLVSTMLLMTRITAAPILLFFALELWHPLKFNRAKVRKSIQLLLPVVIGIGVLGLYNYLRFGSPLNGGFKYQLLFNDSAQSRALGIFSLIHVPAGLYTAIFRAPVPVLRSATSWTLKFPYIQNNNDGLSIFINSPYLLYLFSQKWSSFNRQSRHLLIAIAVSALGVFSYYGLGLNQFGYRYTLDFLPEVFLLFMIMYRKHHSELSRGMKILLLGSGFLNFYLVWSYLSI